MMLPLSAQLIAEPEAPAQELKVADLIEDFRKLYVVETYNNGGTRPNIDGEWEDLRILSLGELLSASVHSRAFHAALNKESRFHG